MQSFTSSDQLREKFPNIGSYVYCHDNPTNRIDPDGRDDFFKPNGTFIKHTDNRDKDGNLTNNIYISSAKKTNVLLSNYTFGKHNGGTLARIGSYYAKKAGLDMSKLSNNNFSVANRYYDSNLPSSENLYNNGRVSSSEDIMNQDETTKTVTFSLQYGKVDELLNNSENFTSTIKHEFDHVNGNDEINTLYNQIKDPTFKNTTQDFKNNTYEYVKDVVSEMRIYQDPSWSRAQINMLHKQADVWKRKLEKAGVKF